MADEPKKTISEQLYDDLVKRFGNDWRATLNVPARADVLYWVVYLAVYGLAAKKTELRAKPANERDASDVASICSWEVDLEQFARNVVNAPPAKRK